MAQSNCSDGSALAMLKLIVITHTGVCLLKDRASVLPFMVTSAAMSLVGTQHDLSESLEVFTTS